MIVILHGICGCEANVTHTIQITKMDGPTLTAALGWCGFTDAT